MCEWCNCIHNGQNGEIWDGPYSPTNSCCHQTTLDDWLLAVCHQFNYCNLKYIKILKCNVLQHRFRSQLVVPFFLPIAQPSKSPKEALPEQSVDAAHGRQKADRDRRPCPGFLQTYKPSPKSTEFPSIQLQQVLPLFPLLWTLAPVSFTFELCPLTVEAAQT